MVNLKQWLPVCGTRATSGRRRISRWFTNGPAFGFSRQKNIFTAIIFADRVLLINSCICVRVGFKKGHKFSHTFCSCWNCVNSGFPNFWSNNIWKIEDWVFLERDVTCWQYETHKWYAIRSLGTTDLKTIQKITPMDVCMSGTIDQKTYLKQFRGASAP